MREGKAPNEQEILKVVMEYDPEQIELLIHILFF